MARLRPDTVNKLILFTWGGVLFGLYWVLEPRIPAGVPDWAVILAGIVVWFAGVLVWNRRQIGQWATVTDTVGLEPVGDPEGSSHRLEKTVDGRSIRVDLTNPKADASPDDKTTVHTRITPPSGGFRLELRQMAPLEEAPEDRTPAGEGMVYTSSQDPRFDDNYHVRATDPDRARQVLSLGARQDLATIGGDLELRIEEADVELTVNRRVLEPDAMRAAVQAVARIADALEASP